MKDLIPLGWTLTPNPVTRSSHAIQGRARGVRASIVRLVRVTLTRAVRLCPVPGMFLKTGTRGGKRPATFRESQHAEGRTHGAGAAGGRFRIGCSLGEDGTFVAQSTT